MNDRDEKPELPVHIILGASEYAKIKTETRPKIGRPGEPVAELTKFGWTIMSPGKEVDLSNMFLMQTAAADFEQLCKVDVLEVTNQAETNQMCLRSSRNNSLEVQRGGTRRGYPEEETTLHC